MFCIVHKFCTLIQTGSVKSTGIQQIYTNMYYFYIIESGILILQKK